MQDILRVNNFMQDIQKPSQQPSAQPLTCQLQAPDQRQLPIRRGRLPPV